MVTDGTCDSIEEAVGRALALASPHDSTQEWSEPESGRQAEVERLMRQLDEEAESGALGANAPALWRRVRELVEALSANRHA
jgi:hypothetical protein